MSDKTLQRLPLALAALLTCLSAHADFTSADGKARLSGFGTVGAARTNTDEALFNYPGQGGGVDKSVGMEPDTKVGVQGSYKFTDTVSGTAQVLTKYRASGQYQPEFEWAFAKWQAMPSLAIRAGRIGAPLFMISDFRDVGYANTPVRPPLDVYGQVPVSSFDGLDIAHQSTFGSMTLTSTLWGGNSRNEYASALRSNGTPAEVSVVHIKNNLGLNLQAEFENGLAVRLGHSGGALSVDSASAASAIAGANRIAALVGAGVPSAAAAARADAANVATAMTTEGARATFTGIGASYDQDNIVLASEFTKRKIKKGYISDTTGWYVLGGYRFGSVLPFVIFSKVKVDDPNTTMPSTPTLSTYGGANTVGLRNAIQGLLNTQKLEQRTLSVGARWDVMRSMALKAQLDHIVKPAGSNGMFLVADPLTAGASSFLNNKKRVNVVSVALDFVF